MRAFILDTNILMAYLKANNQVYTKVSNENKLDDEDALIMISAITKREIQSLSMQNKWGERKVRIAIPEPCDYFKVPFCNTIEMFRKLKVTF